MPGRIFASPSYRYGFNGQERDDEFGCENGSYNGAQFWEYSTRLGKRLNIDPQVYAFESPYLTFANNPIFYTDFAGDNEDERKKALAKAEEYKTKNPGNSYGGGGAMNDPGNKIDCSGMVRKCIISGGIPDPVAFPTNDQIAAAKQLNEGTLNEDVANGVALMAVTLEHVTDNSELKTGMLVVLDNSTDQNNPYGHIGIIKDVELNPDGSIKTLTMYDSGGSPKSGKSGPRISTLYKDGKAEYWGKRMTTFLRWDTKDPNEDAKKKNAGESPLDAIRKAVNSVKSHFKDNNG